MKSFKKTNFRITFSNNFVRIMQNFISSKDYLRAYELLDGMQHIKVSRKTKKKVLYKTYRVSKI